MSISSKRLAEAEELYKAVFGEGQPKPRTVVIEHEPPRLPIPSEEENSKPVVAGPEGEKVPAQGLTLGIEKFRNPYRHYRLIWVRGIEAWPCQEDPTWYKRKFTCGDRKGVFEAGQALAARFSGLVHFSQVTR